MSRSKDNQAMKLGQLIEYNMRNIFPEKSYTKYGGQDFPKNQSWAYLWIKVLYSLSLLYAKLRTIEIYWNQAVWSGTSLPASFSAWFLKKNISLVIFYCLMKFHCLVVFTSCSNGQNAYWNCFLARFWCHRFWS